MATIGKRVIAETTKTLNAILGGCCFAFGILLMGSETGMPWCQIVGVVIFSGTLFFARGD